MSEKTTFYPVAEPDLGALERKYLLDAFDSGWVSSLGDYITRFEKSFAAFCGVEHGVTVSNGTVALQVALVAADVGTGDEVIVPSLTFVATASAVRHVGATPVFVDCESEIGTLDPRKLRDVISPRTKAILPVHLYGHPADMDPIMECAREHGLIVIEDAAEAHGARYKGRPVGSLGHMATFSFYGNKIITTGEGGMVVTADERFASKVRFLKDHAMDPQRRYWHPIVGFNFRMTNLQAAIGCAQLERFAELTAKRQAIQDAYRARLAPHGIEVNPYREWASPVPWLVCALLPSGTDAHARDEIAVELKSKGFDSRPYFYLIPDMPPYAARDASSRADQYPCARSTAGRGMNLPSTTNLPESAISEICNALAAAVKRVRRRATPLTETPSV
jgi:perosamine synthetase